MARAATLFVCQTCGHQSPKWLGRCPECGAWGALAEERAPAGKAAKAGSLSARPAIAMPLNQVSEEAVPRFASGLPLLDRVLGGGLVPGGAVLIAGEPGIGKSTLLLQAAEQLARQGKVALYISAEESPRQLRLRAVRLGVGHSGLLVAGENALESILAAAEREEISALFVDSVQAVRSDAMESPAGSIGQVRFVADRLVEFAKRRDVALFLVGHVTKEGSIAGPKALEHLVDTVLAFEGEAESQHRLLRATKNRFGPTGEVGMFEMREGGLVPVEDPSRALLERRRGDAPGSAVVASLQGSRPLLVEVQALVNPTKFPSPRRMAVGLEMNRVVLLLAVLERFAGLHLGDADVFLNAVGGLSVREPAADLGTAAALLSAAHDKPLPADMVFFGEVGLLGEVREVSQSEGRLREAAHLGFKTACVARQASLRAGGVTCRPVDTVTELAAMLVRG
ncbi:MAG: DNA repair protein RadA [Acidobacteriota bacterium]